MKTPVISTLLALLIVPACAPPVRPIVAPERPTAVASSSAVSVISGLVVMASGAPVEGAIVALVAEDHSAPEDGTRPAARTTSDARGAFRFEGVPKGDYSLTATSLRAAGGAATTVRLAEAASVTDIGITIPKEGVTLSGAVRDARGGAAPNVEVRVVRFRDAAGTSGDVFFTTTDDAGLYVIRVPAGQYSVAAVSAAHAFEPTSVPGEGDRRHDLVLEDPVVQTPPGAEVVDWMKAHAIPIARADAGHGLSDLAPLEAVVGDARVVSLGEATHGTREFFQLKHRMFELLATKKGFNVFAIEATMPEGFDVDEYVLTGRGDAEKALASLYVWTWNTEEVLDLIRWMRAYNADPKHTKKLRFYGFDMQTPTRAARVVRQYLREVAASTLTATDAMLSRLATPSGHRRPGPPGADDGEVSTAVVEDFDKNRVAWQKRSGAEQWEVARQHAVVLSQFTRQPAAGLQKMSVRDASMAANVRWILDQNRTSKVVLWAHNGHISMNGMGAVESMGQSLKKTLGHELVTIGFAFNRGSFQAMEMPFASGRGLRHFTVGPEAPGSLGASLALAGHPIAAFDLRTIPATGPVHDWFSARRPVRELGSGFDERLPSTFDVPTRVAERFDVVVFVESTTAARPVGGRTKRAPLEVARNLDFEEPGKGIPVGWGARGAATWGYTVEVVDGGAKQGKRSLSMRRAPGRHYGERNGDVGQHVEARPFQGKRVTVSADVKASFIGDGASAVLWAQATPPLGPSTTVVITSKEWTRVSVSVDVPAGAETLTYGLELVGDGRIDADAFAIEAVTRLERPPRPVRWTAEHGPFDLIVSVRSLQGFTPDAARDAIRALDRRLGPTSALFLGIINANTGTLDKLFAPLAELGIARWEGGERPDGKVFRSCIGSG